MNENNLKKILDNAAEHAIKKTQKQLELIEQNQEFHQIKLLKAFQAARVSESHFAGSTGYGYGDRGREALDEVYRNVFEAESALVRHNFVSGTHAITVALFGVLRPGDEVLCVTGTPYDTIRGVLGIGENSSGSLKEFGIVYKELPLHAKGRVDLQKIPSALTPKTRMVYIQRSRGYTLRPSLTVADIKAIAEVVKANSTNCIVFADNCYGEFTEKPEPLQCGADLIAGSLIKNAGGGIAPTGGYIAGKKELVEQCAYRLTTPGTGGEVGCTLSVMRQMFLGAFNAPHATGEALKTAIFAAALFEELGFEVTPTFEEPRPDIIQTVKFNNEQEMIAFCRGIQSGSAVDSFVVPEPWDMPGYDCKVIMAAGAFTLGSSIELSADAPLRPPYCAWLQGGLNFHSGKYGVLKAAEAVLKTRGS
ncbi:MAG: methionine gamma-lyase family protein [Oscillospiraceae bacterium]|jgi:cystathionine beta-lyase family protein involved in aluminum resistance|nr:methionine gamma-lyase family protein [Oscillospiraceae bacterium]